MSDEKKFDRHVRERIARWFAAGMRHVIEPNPHAVAPCNPDCQCDTGPHPYTDAAYEAGVVLAKRMLDDEAAGSAPCATPDEIAELLRIIPTSRSLPDASWD